MSSKSRSCSEPTFNGPTRNLRVFLPEKNWGGSPK